MNRLPTSPKGYTRLKKTLAISKARQVLADVLYSVFITLAWVMFIINSVLLLVMFN